MDGFADLLCELVEEAGIKRAQMFSGKSRSELPGFYRPTKNWDWIIVADGQLLALLELKSQVGPSFGNNFNNRVEEALGNATDLWKAYSEGTFGTNPRPWAGFLMLLEHDPASSCPVKVDEPQFPVRPEFRHSTYVLKTKPIGVSYATRYELFCRKIVRDRLYDAACLLLSERDSGLKRGTYNEPAGDLTFKSFVAALVGKASEHQKLRNLGVSPKKK